MNKLFVLSLFTAVIVIGGMLNPPMAIPAEPAVVKSAEEIVGTWVTNGKLNDPRDVYLRFDKDGTGRQTYEADKLDSEPLATNSYEFKGAEMLITEISVASDIPSCGKVVGHYEIRLLESGGIRIGRIDEHCLMRAVGLEGEYKPVR